MIDEHSYFPAFLDIKNKPCLIVGGGRIALHKLKVIMPFQPIITIVAPDICDKIMEIGSKHTKVSIIVDEFNQDFLRDSKMVIAATDDYKLNSRVSALCREKGILINAVDQPRDCDFIFPSITRKGPIVAAVSSGGKSPIVTQYLRNCIEEKLTDGLADMTEYLGSIRQYVKENIETEAERKQLYKTLLKFFLENERIPDDSVLEELICKNR